MPGREKLPCNTTRHDAVAAALRGLFGKILWETQVKGRAGWVVGAPDLRSYTAPARPDSSTPWMGTDAAVAGQFRNGYLSTGQRYFKKASAAVRYVHKKQTQHNRPLTRHSTRYLISCAGGFSKKVCSLLS